MDLKDIFSQSGSDESQGEDGEQAIPRARARGRNRRQQATKQLQEESNFDGASGWQALRDNLNQQAEEEDYGFASGARTDYGDAGQGEAPSGLVAPKSLEEMGIVPRDVESLILRMIYYAGEMSVEKLSNRLRLQMSLFKDIMTGLVDENVLYVKSSSGLGGLNRVYAITTSGFQRTQEAFAYTRYVGPTPVSLREYMDVAMNYPLPQIKRQHLHDALSDMVLDPSFVDGLGPFLGSFGDSALLQGPSGSGKTSIINRIGDVFSDSIVIPYAVNIFGVPVRLFDREVHRPISQDELHKPMREFENNEDARWIHIKRPCVIMGEHFSGKDLAFQYSTDTLECLFPYTIKANGGVLILDNLGGQSEPVENLLMHLLEILESGHETLLLNNGQRVRLPFRATSLFSTIVPPQQLFSERTLKHINYKLDTPTLSLEGFCEIFANEAATQNVSWTDEILEGFIRERYLQPERQLSALEARHLVRKVADTCRFFGQSPPYQLDKKMLDLVCKSYFLD